MKIATYNINGINGRLSVLLRWLKDAKPDIVCLQELKAPQEKFPLKAIQNAGYDAIWHGQTSWNGVAILSKIGQLQEVRRTLPGDPKDNHSRYIEAIINDMLVCCLYLPNGNPAPGPKFDYKLKWFNRLTAHTKKLLAYDVPVVLVGDFNVMPAELDVYKPEGWLDNALFRPEVRQAFKKLLTQGWTDALRKLYPEKKIYTFWKYFRDAFARNAGLRIDHFLLSSHLDKRLISAGVDRKVRGWEKTSDHAPAWIELTDTGMRTKPAKTTQSATLQSKPEKSKTNSAEKNPPIKKNIMSLEKYDAKRDFTKTAEPKGGKSTNKNKLMFVIQKHEATRLHYDFRLEMDGVLKSWAVPKGPSINPKDKRLAMMVEDHPFDYRNFEGMIPKGEYGGGTVIVWDEGEYEPLEPIKGKKAQEKHLLEQLKSGSLKIKLHGQKLNGEFAFVKTKGMGENAWLLIKHNDEYASSKDITKQDKSVLSGKTIAGMAKTSDKVWKAGREQKVTADSTNTKKKVPVKKTKIEHNPASNPSTDIAALLKAAPTSKIPTGITPMLATLVDKPFEDSEWVFEVKWDGYRALSFINKGKVELLSRNNKSFDEKFYPVRQALLKWKINAVVDGEILVLNDKGISNFGNLQNWRSEADGELVYYIFDLLWYEGKNLMDLPLTERQAILKSVLPVDDVSTRISTVFDTSGLEFFKAAEQMGLEGIIAKQKSGMYSPKVRTKTWLKVKVNKRQEVVIAGFTKNEDTAKQFSSLILGVYEQGKLQFAGKVGTGFSDADQKAMMAQFKPLIIDKSPFEIVPDVNAPSRFRPKPPKAEATWLKPKLVCEVSFAEITTDGVFRHPSFQGMRMDKKAAEVVREVASPTSQAVVAAKGNKKEIQIVRPSKGKERKTLLNPTDETQVRKINGHELKFTNLSKVYWPEDKITKRDMFNYYYQVAEYISPYLKDRPLSLNRFPGGIHGQSFYQKDVKGKAPAWITKTFPYTTSDGEAKEYLVGSDEAVLLWMATLGCIEMNPWFSRVQSPENPDYCVIDLDPDKNTFNQVIEAALEVKKVLDALDVPCYCKTSGSTGIHIYIPLGAKYTYDQSQMFARYVVNIVHDHLPDYTSLERKVASRKGKMYLDFLQNRPGATIACPYSLRPKIGATVSMPLHWDEVKPGLTMKDFTIFNSVDRIKEQGDIFKNVLAKGIDLVKTLKKAGSVFGSSV